MCPLHLLSLETVQWKKSAVLGDAQRCTGCRECATTCPFHAITMQRQEELALAADRQAPAG
jgi:Fe-S-cluster-containing hydrogenase component 2